SRPFDRGRDGFVIGEGAGVIVLEALEHAEARGAEPLAELVGYGATADASHITLPAPGGIGAVRAIRTIMAVAAERAAITANKSMIGHTLGAAGALEAIATILAIRTGCIPP